MTAPVPSSESRLDAIQALRGIAALMVMASHLWIIEQKYSPDQILGRVADFGMIGVDIFFAISGFIMVYVTQDASPSAQAAGRFLFARLTRIYPIYLVITLILFVVWKIAPEMVFASFNQSPDILKSFLLWPDERPPLLAVGWTLIHEVFFYLIFAFSLLISKRLLLPFLMGWAAMTMLGYAGGFAALSVETSLLFNPLSLEFIMGAMAAWIFIRVNGQFSQLALMAGIAGLGLAILLLIGQAYYMPTLPWLRVLYFGLPTSLLVYGLAGWTSSGIKVPKTLIHLGDCSYALYLTHILTLSLLGRLWHSLAAPGWIDNLLALIILSAVSIIVAWVTWLYIEKPMLSSSKKMRQRLFRH